MTDNKLKHVYGVAKKMVEIGKINNLTESELKELFILGFLHDIGYEFTDNRKHNAVGGEMLIGSNYKYWQEVYYHGIFNSPYKSLYLDILNAADLMIDKYGHDVGFDKRLEDIKSRYGKDSTQYQNCIRIVNDLKISGRIIIPDNSERKTMIISAFPGCGKTYLYDNQDKYNYKILDSDSSRYEKHEGWELEYVNHICENIGKYDFIFIAQYPKVLEILNIKNIPFTIVAPDNSKELSEKERQLIKQQWFGRFLLRDNSHIKDFKTWIEKLSINYDNWTSYEQLTKYNPAECILLKENEYLSDRVEYLYSKKEQAQNILIRKRK